MPRSSGTVNFAGVEVSGGRSAHVPEGRYQLKVLSGSLEESDRGEYILWEVTFTDKRYKGKKIYHNTSLLPKAVWNLKKMMVAAGIDPGEKKVGTDSILRSMRAKTFYADLMDDEYNGRVKSIIDDYVLPDDLERDDDDEDEEEEEDEEDEEEEVPTRRSRARATSKATASSRRTSRSSSSARSKRAGRGKAKDEDEDEEDEDEDLDELDLDDL